jgi:CheY-like chemotaxis protein
MSKNGPIILIEDDLEDQEMTKEVIVEIGITNTIVCFTSCTDAYKYLSTNLHIQPFIILSDINLPKMNGIDLKHMINANESLRSKSIPFIFYSTSGDKQTVSKAFEEQVQGYFIKDFSVNDIKENLKLILTYWQKCRHPNN